MDEGKPGYRTRWRTRYRNRGCGCGCGSFFLVLTVGILLSLFRADIGIGVSVRVPFTEANITIAGAVGTKDKILAAMPAYTEGRLGGNQNFINNTTTMTIGPAEGAALVVIGKQAGAPPADIYIVIR
jgi:hypothetical protein